MEGYFGNNSNFNRINPPLNLPNDSLSLFTSPRDYDHVARVRHYDDSVMLRYLLSGSSSSDEFTTPRNRPAAIGSEQLRFLSSSSSGGCLTPRRRSPLSPLENLENSPSRRSELASKAVKIEEDVLVMDAIPLRSVVRAGGGSRTGKMKSPLSLPSDLGSLQSSPPLTNYIGLHKREICRSWEDFGTCRYGSKCMFAHGKEEVGPRISSMTRSEFAHYNEEIDPRILSMTRSETGHSKEEIDPRIIGKIKYEFKDETDPRIISKTQSKFTLGKENIDPRLIIIGNTNSRINMCKSNFSTVNTPAKSNLKEKGIVLLNDNWSPLDDGIQLNLPREVTEEYLDTRLHGVWPSQKKRLPVFEEICPQWKTT